MTKEKRDPVGVVLYVIYVLLLIASLVVIGGTVYLQVAWKPDERIRSALRPAREKKAVVTEPSRGNILDSQGRLLAISSPTYQFGIDYTVGKDAYPHLDSAERRSREAEWDAKARALAAALPAYFPGKTAAQYLSSFRDARKHGVRYLAIGKPVDHKTCLGLRQLPLFNEDPNRGGRCETRREVRSYPYGKLARRTIGFVRSNDLKDVSNNHVGLEGRFNHELHGQQGRKWLRKTDMGYIHNHDSIATPAVDGKDLRTTLNIDYQDLADQALREQIEQESDLDGACLVLMEVKTGAIRAMVNLSRTADAPFDEIANIAIGRRQEPGSVFKTATLMSVLSDGHIKSLEDKIPTNHGVVQDTRIPPDQHILDYERTRHTNRISVFDGFKMSSNYVFATLAVKNYGKTPRKYIENLYAYKLADSFDFDLEGLATAEIPTPETRYWTNTDLGNIGFGYTTLLTPLHILTFYNAIAGKGRMMKPYLVESIERDGRVTAKRGPQVLSASICSKAVADTLTRALKAVTEDGTAKWAFRDCACQVAGKTGTSFGTFNINGKAVYKDADGRRKYQGTFAGFFPADDPQYSIICMIYSKPTRKSFQGGGIPARAVRKVIDGLYRTDPYFRPTLEKKI